MMPSALLCKPEPPSSICLALKKKAGVDPPRGGNVATATTIGRLGPVKRELERFLIRPRADRGRRGRFVDRQGSFRDASVFLVRWEEPIASPDGGQGTGGERGGGSAPLVCILDTAVGPKDLPQSVQITKGSSAPDRTMQSCRRKGPHRCTLPQPLTQSSVAANYASPADGPKRWTGPVIKCWRDVPNKHQIIIRH